MAYSTAAYSTAAYPTARTRQDAAGARMTGNAQTLRLDAAHIARAKDLITHAGYHRRARNSSAPPTPMGDTIGHH